MFLYKGKPFDLFFQQQMEGLNEQTTERGIQLERARQVDSLIIYRRILIIILCGFSYNYLWRICNSVIIIFEPFLIIIFKGVSLQIARNSISRCLQIFRSGGI